MKSHLKIRAYVAERVVYVVHNVVVYVDDLLIGSKNVNEIIKVKNLLKKKFKTTDLGEAKDILGINICT